MKAKMFNNDNLNLNINLTYNSYMFFLSIPQAWHLVGTWSEQLPNESNLIGMNQTELMMTLHSIFVPLLLVISYYLFIRLNKNESKKIKG